MEKTLEKIGNIKILPVANTAVCEKNKTLDSAVRGLLNPENDMFRQGEIIKALMTLEGTDVKQTAKMLSLSLKSVENKLLLLSFKEGERNMILKAKMSEKSALLFVNLKGIKRVKALCECINKKFSYSQIQSYLGEQKDKRETRKFKPKFALSDVRFLTNSIENAIRIAREGGVEVQKECIEDEKNYFVNLRIPKKTDTPH